MSKILLMPWGKLKLLSPGWITTVEIVGEATKRLPISLRDQYPHIPWKKMAGMRGRIFRGYDNVDLEIVWDVVKQDIPQVKPHLQQILADYDDPLPPEDGE